MKLRFTKLLKSLFIVLVALAGLLAIIFSITHVFVYDLRHHAYVPAVLPSFTDKFVSMFWNTSLQQYKLTPNIRSLNRSEIIKLVNLPSIIEKKSTSQLSQNGVSHPKDHMHSILWINKPPWIDLVSANHNLMHNCAYSNCRMTDDKTDLLSPSAIVFTLTSWGMGLSPPLKASARPKDQVWVFFFLESPINVWPPTYRFYSWRYTMNWSMTYRQDADILLPYGSLKTRTLPLQRDHRETFDRKTKFAAWIVSHCGAESGRDEYVEKLQRHGVPVDVYGRCAGMDFIDHSVLMKKLDNDYKFYLSFENSLCSDYVTEKFFEYYKLDIVLVVRGGANYSELLPHDTFIDTSKFNSVRMLAEYLLMVNSSRSMYTEYLKQKDNYETFDAKQYSFCKLCEKLNYKEDNRKIYDDITSYIHNIPCSDPKDVQRHHFWRDLILVVLGLTIISIASLLNIKAKCTRITNNV